MPIDFRWPRNGPICTTNSDSFWFDDFVETNDRSVHGFVRGFMIPGPTDRVIFYAILQPSGDVITLMGATLHLVFRIQDPVARQVAIDEYLKERA